MSGTVVSAEREAGPDAERQPAAPIVVRIADLSTMTVQSQVSEADVSKLRVGQDVYFTTLGNQDEALVRKAAPDQPDARSRQQRRALQRALRRREPGPRADDADDGAGVLRHRAGEGRRARAGERAAPGRRAAKASAAARRRSGDEAASAPSEASEGAATRKAASAARKAARRARARSGVDPRTRFASGRAMVRVVKADGTIEEREVQRRRDEPRLGADPLGPRSRRAGGDRARRAPRRAAKATANDAPRMQPRI